MNKEIVGFTAGNFDLLHPGYIYTFEEAKKHCDYFMIFLQRDPSLHRKSKYKPVIPIFERYHVLKSIKYVDEVQVYQTEKELYDLMKFFKPDIRILGDDYIDFKKHFFKNLIFPNAWLSIFYFIFRKFTSIFKSRC